MDRHLFFERPEPLTLADVAALTGATLIDPSLASRLIEGLAVLDEAGPRHLTFLEDIKYLSQLEHSQAGACFVTARLEHKVPSKTAALRVASPHRAFVAIARKFNPDALR